MFQVPTESQVPGPRGELCTWACLAAPMAWICLFPAERGTLGILDLLAAESCGSAAVPSLPPLCPAASQHGNVEGPDPVWEGARERHPSAEPYQTFTPMPQRAAVGTGGERRLQGPPAPVLTLAVSSLLLSSLCPHPAEAQPSFQHQPRGLLGRGCRGCLAAPGAPQPPHPKGQHEPVSQEGPQQLHLPAPAPWHSLLAGAQCHSWALHCPGTQCHCLDL